MPTALPRFQVTETREIERALNVARERWPGASRSELVSRLFLTAAAVLENERDSDRAQRIAAVDSTAGTLDIAYEPGYLETLRSEWPE